MSGKGCSSVGIIGAGIQGVCIGLQPLKKNITLSPDALIVPLLAFDKKKNRLGYGGGYYDRYLNNKTKKNILLIGLGFSFQKTKIVPVTKYDKKMDYIITEKETIY